MPLPCGYIFPPIAPGYTRIPRSLYPEGKPFHLAIAYASDSDLQAININMQWLESLKINDTIDILSSDKQWRLGKIVSFINNGKTAHVSFNGWTAAFNEDIPRSLRRLAKAGAYTAGKDTGNARRQGAEFQFDYEEIVSYEKKVRMLINDEFPSELKDSFCKAELPQFVFDVMSSKYHEDVTCTDTNGETITLTADGVRDRVNEFNVLLLQFIAKELKDYPRPLAPDVLQHVQRYFLLDDQCNYFYDHHEFMNLTHKDAHKYIGFAASFSTPTGTQSKYWVNNINAFHNAGGLEAMIGRIEYHARQSLTEMSDQSSSSSSTSSSAHQPWNDEKAAIEFLTLTKAICNTRVIITKEWAAQYFARYRDAVFIRINSLTETQLKKIALNEVTKELISIESLANSLVRKAGGTTTPMGKQIVMGPDFDTNQPCEEPSVPFEKYSIDFAINLLGMDSFVLRLKGLAEINAFANRVFPLGTSDTYYTNSKSNRLTSVSYTDFLIKLRDRKVIDVLFGGTGDSKRPAIAPHVQLLTRLSQRDSFLLHVAKDGASGEHLEYPSYSYTGFTKHHLTLLCELFRKEMDDSSIRHALMDIVQVISVSMDREQHDQLYQFLYTLPRKVYDVHFVNSLSFLTREAISSFRIEIEISYRDLESQKKTAASLPPPSSKSGSVDWQLPDDLSAIENNEDDMHHWYTIPQLWTISLDIPPDYATITNMYPTEQQRISAQSSTSYGCHTLPSLDATEAAQTALLDILSTVDKDTRTITFRLANMAAESIANGTANYNTVRMLHRLFRDIPITSTAYRKITQNSVIQTLQSQYKICEALVADIQRYKALASIEAQKRGGISSTSSSFPSVAIASTDSYKTAATTENSSTDTNVTVHSTASIDSLVDPKEWILVGRYKHLDQLLTRLTLLTFIGKSKSSGFSFTADHVDTLWTALVENAINVEEVEMFFDWLQKSINADLISISQSSIVFDRCFCGTTPRLSTEKLGLNGYECFYALFRQVNVESGKIHYNNILEESRTRNPDLNGLSTLWKIVLHNENEDVAEKASNTLVQLHSHLDLPWYKNDKEETLTRQEVWKKFVTECITAIQQFVPNVPQGSTITNTPLSPASTRSIYRLIRILQNFLEELDTLAFKLGKADKVNDKTVIATDFDFPFPPHWKRGNDIFYLPITVRLIERTTFKTSLTAPVVLMFRIRKGIDNIGMLRDRTAEAFDKDPKKLIIALKPSATQDAIILRDDEKPQENMQGKFFIEELVESSMTAEYSAHEYRQDRDRLKPFLLGIATLLGKEGTPGITVDNLYDQLQNSFDECIAHYESAKRLISDRGDLFDTLFNLLSLKDSSIVNMLWSLISVTLPVPKILQDEVETLANHFPTTVSTAPVSWDSILGGKSLMHLYYKLNIITLILERDIEPLLMKNNTDRIDNNNEPSESNAGSSKSTKSTLSIPFASSGQPEINTPWSKAFVKYGGLQYLYNLIMTLPLPQLFSADGSSQLQRDCAAELINMFSTFIVGPSYILRYFMNDDATKPSEIFRADRLKLLYRMLEWLSYVSTIDIPLSINRNNNSSTPSTTNESKNDASVTTMNGAASAPSTPNRRTGTPGGKDKGTPSPGKASSPNSKARSPIGRGRTTPTKIDTKDSFSVVSEKKETDLSTEKDNENANVPEVSIVGAVWNIITACIVGKDSSAYVSLPRYETEKTDLRCVSTIAQELALSSTAVSQLAMFPSIGQVLVTALCAPSNNIVRQQNNERLFSLLNVADNYVQSVPNDTTAKSLYQQLRGTILQILFDNLHIPYAFPSTCNEYFGLIISLLPGMVSSRIVPLPMDEYSLMQKLVHRLRQHPVVEVGSSAEDIVDNTLTGLLRIISAVLRGRPLLKKVAGAPVTMLLPSLTDPSTTVSGLGLVDEIFDSCLFSLLPIDQAEESTSIGITSVFGAKLPKCKQDSTRTAALVVLTELSKDCIENGVYLCRKFMPHHDVYDSTNTPPPTANSNAQTNPVSTDGSVDIFRTANAGATLLGSNENSNAKATTSVMAMDTKEGTELNMTARTKNRIASRNSTGYVGIANLGCICYMNSTLQQFFMNPAFRRGVLSYKETTPGTDAERTDNIMYQLQRQFAYLQEIDREYYNPASLCRAIKDWNGNPINLFDQKDVPEFLTKLFADIESQLQGKPLATLSKDVYGGRQLQELVADDPRGLTRKQLYAAREEEFHFIQVRVKNYKNIQEALAAYVAGESVEYKWTLPDDPDTVEKKTGNASLDEPGSSSNSTNSSSNAGSSAPPDPPKPKEETLKTNKRVSLRSVGDHLMLHLNRFDFDFNRMEQVKLNDRFEFPVVLDMFPYTVYARDENDVAYTSVKPPRSDFIYDLVGVVIHRGSAHGGHYFSYIRERGPNGPVPGDRWFEFNDERVLPWEGEERLEADCFGGKQIVRTVTKWGTVYENEVFTHESAFCLFYDRRKPESAMHNNSGLPIVTVPRTHSAPKDCVVTTDTTNDKGGFTTITVPRPALVNIPTHSVDLFVEQIKASYQGGSDSVRKLVRAPVPEDLLRTIQNENLEFTRFMYIYTLAYARTILEVVRNFATEAKIISSNGNVNSTPTKTFSSITTYAYPWDRPYVPTAREISLTGHPGLVALRLSIAYLLRTLSDTAHPTGVTMVDWEPVVHGLLSVSPIAPVWFLQTLLENKTNLANVLLDNNNLKSTKPLLAKLIIQALQVLWPIESTGTCTAVSTDNTSSTLPLSSTGGENSIPTGKLCITMIDFLLERLPGTYRYCLRGGFENYFAILASFASMDYTARQYLVSKRTIAKIMDILLCSRSPFPDINKETITVNTDNATSNVGKKSTGISFKNLGARKDKTFTGSSSSSGSWSDEDEGIYSQKKTTTLSSSSVSVTNGTTDLRSTDIWDLADIQYDLKSLLQLLRLLVFSCLPLSNRAEAPMVQKFGNGSATLPLHAVDRRFLTHWEFWHLYFASRLSKEDRFSVRKLTYENIGPILYHLLYGLEPVPLRTTDIPPTEKGARIRYEVEGYGDYHGVIEDTIELTNVLTVPIATTPLASKIITFGAKDKQPKEKETTAITPKINYGTPGHLLSILMGIVRHSLRTKGDDQLIGPFELIEFLLKYHDDDPETYTKRCEFILGHFNLEMKINTLYYKDTELCLVQLVRWAKKYPVVRYWGSQNWFTLAWAEDWLVKNFEPPETNIAVDGSMKITKDKPRPDPIYMYSTRLSSVTVPERNPDLYDNIRRLRRYLTLAHRFVDYDTDSIHQYVGRSIAANARDPNGKIYAFEGKIIKIITEGSTGYEIYKFAIQPNSGGAQQNLEIKRNAYYYQIHAESGEEPGDPDVWNTVNQEWIRSQMDHPAAENGKSTPVNSGNSSSSVNSNVLPNLSLHSNPVPRIDEPPVKNSFEKPPSKGSTRVKTESSPRIVKETDDDYEEHVGFYVPSDDEDDEENTFDEFDVDKRPIRSTLIERNDSHRPRTPPLPPGRNPLPNDDDNASDDAQADENDTQSEHDDDNEDIVDHEGQPVFSSPSGSSSSVPTSEQTEESGTVKLKFGSLRFGTALSSLSSSSSSSGSNFPAFGRGILKPSTGNSTPTTPTGSVTPPIPSQFSMGVTNAKKVKSPKRTNSTGKK